MSLSRSFNRWANKQTYDPELEKQLAEERKKAREARTQFRESLDEMMKKDRDLIVQDKLTPLGASQSAALFKTMNDWLAATPEATAVEIEDRSMETKDKLANIYREDNNRIYFYSFLKFSDIGLKNAKQNNMIDEDTYKKCYAILEREQKFLEKNPSESMQTYKEHLEKATQEVMKLLNDPETQRLIKNAQNKVKNAKSADDLSKTQEKLESDIQAKEELKKREFNMSRLLSKVGAGFLTAFWISLALALAFFGASIASNQAVVRPISYRWLYFIYGFIFFPVVLTYAIFRTVQGKPPYFAAYLIPLYEYNPLKEKKDSFLQRLVWFKSNAVIDEAQKTFQNALTNAQGLQLNFVGIAKEAMKV